MIKQIGLPRVLITYSLFPFLTTFFKELGIDVVLSDETDEYYEAACIGIDEDICFPVRLLRPHIANLLQKGVTTIFIPTAYTVKLKNVNEKSKYGCMYMQCLDYFISHDSILKSFNALIIAPQLNIDFNNPYFDDHLNKQFLKLGYTPEQLKSAFYKAGSALVYQNNIYAKEGYNTIKNKKVGEKVIVLINNDYICKDPLLNLGLKEKFTSMGYKFLNLESLYLLMNKSASDFDGIFWSFGQSILRGARTVHDTPDVYGVMIVDRQCGPNNILVQLVSDIMGDKPLLLLDIHSRGDIEKVDGKVKAFAKRIEGLKKNVFFKIPKRGLIQENYTSLKKDSVLVFPYFNVYSRIFAEKLSSLGYAVELMPPTTIESVEAGLVNTHRFSYVSLQAMAGDVLSWITKNKSRTVKKQIVSFRTEGAENDGMFALIIRILLDSIKRDDIDIFAPYIERLIEDEKFSMSFDLLWSTLLQGDEELRVLLCEAGDNKNRPTVFVSGEPYIILNKVLNGEFLYKIAHRFANVAVSSLSEYVLFLWHDKIRSMKAVSPYTEKLYDKCNQDIYAINENFDELIHIADTKLPHLKGGNIRYRYAKMIQGYPGACMQINMSSKNENAANVLTQLQYTIKPKVPFINLTFDGGDIDDQMTTFVDLFNSLK